MSLNPNRCALIWAALLVFGCGLSACSRPESNRPLGAASAAQKGTPALASASRPVTGGMNDGSLPDTAAALSTPGTASAAKSSSTSTMTRDQESKAMPMPGQVNDHSTPVKPKSN